ncbi:MAG: YcxB family protein [Pirellulaceae bacterium]
MPAPDLNPYAAPQSSGGNTLDTPPPMLGTPVVLSGVVGLDHHLRAHELELGRFRIGWQLPLTGTLLIVAVGSATALALRDGRPVFWGLVLIALIGPPLCVLLIVGLRRLGPWRTKRAFARGQLQPQHAIWTISDDGVHAVTSDVNSQERWSNYRSWRASDDMLLLYGRNAGIYIPLPREFCPSEADWQRLRAFVQERLPENVGGSPR